MARFKRDEQRTFPIWWLLIGGFFAFSTAWACYAEFVTRVPWQKEQGAFFDTEYHLAKKGLDRAKAEFNATVKPEIDKLQARKDQLDHEQSSGGYAGKKATLKDLNQKFANAEQKKTFGKSDLD